MNGPSEVPPPSVLVIDDEPGLRNMLAYSLPQWGYRVVTAAGGAEALELARHQRFDAALCDISMPNMNGLEVLKNLRAIQPKLPVIMMTGFGTPESAREADALGAFGYIAKPFHLDELESMIGRAVAPAGGPNHGL